MKEIVSAVGFVCVFVLPFFALGLAGLYQLFSTWSGNLFAAAFSLLVALFGFGLGVGFITILVDSNKHHVPKKK